MSDIQKLHKVIESLEEQSSRVNEFNGVLHAVNLAKGEIASAKDTLEVLSEEQQKLITNSYSKFDEYGKKLEALEVRLSALETKIVTADQFELRCHKIEQTTSNLRFLSAEQFEKDIGTFENKMTSLIAERNNNILKFLENQQSTINSLKKLMVVGMLVLAGGLLFLAKDGFM